ncbi:hypothetical protein LOTGIDRAFT_154281 [Lottia gigantea]|uniref:Uncharacterized protein n=1 Tax=Lottia gigantea TaxID=225164 RepID=V3ZXQ9_LOTGI|nr:hypothetical protein LOTGIDRAFT_154281 [Lottia gigantea]ESO89192.1 hypothetical protein LOTGIDRAFT_154281 [Lottia gigantea]
MVDPDISFEVDAISLSDILCFLEEDDSTTIKHQCVEIGANSDMAKTSEEIISDHIVTYQQRMTKKPKLPKIHGHQLICKPLLGEPNRGQPHSHEHLEDEYWKLKLDLLGLKQIQDRLEQEQEPPKPVEIALPKPKKKQTNYVRAQSKPKSNVQYNRPCSKGKPSTPEAKRFEFEHFHHFLSSVKFDSRIKSAPPEGRGSCVNVRHKDNVKHHSDMGKLSIKNIP